MVKQPLSSHLSLTLSQKLTDYSLRLNAASGELISWYIDFLAENGSSKTPRDEAIASASEAASLPEDAILREADYDTTSGRTIFRARWCHTLEDLPIEGDFIEVLLNGELNRPFADTRRWRTPDLSGKVQKR